MSTVGEYIVKYAPCHEGLRPYYVSLVDRFHELGLADKHFDTELMSGDDDKFWQRIWEAILGCHFTDVGYEVSSQDEGPDFLIEKEGRRIWVEAICPRPKGIPQSFSAPKSADGPSVTSVPTDALLLNWTAALKEKMEKLEGAGTKAGYRQNGIVEENEPYVIAVNSGRLGYAEMGLSQFPYSAEVGFGIGPMQVTVNVATGQFGEPEHSRRLQVLNRNGSVVSTVVLGQPEYAGVSAVLSTGHLCPQPDEYPFIVVYNPFARAQLPVGVLGKATEYVSEFDDEYMVVRRKD